MEDNKELKAALKFLERTKEGDYTDIDISKLQNKRMNLNFISAEEDIFLYSISN